MNAPLPLRTPDEANDSDNEENNPLDPNVLTEGHSPQTRYDNKFCTHACDVFCVPCCPLTNVTIVSERQHVVELLCGEYYCTITEPGCYWRSCFFEKRRVAVWHRTLNLPETKVLDIRGVPVNVSAIVTYYVEDAKRSVFDIAIRDTFLPAIRRRQY